jgi:hypothetical protein
MEAVVLGSAVEAELQALVGSFQNLPKEGKGEPSILLLALEKIDTETFADILIEFVPVILERFAKASRDYGSKGANRLGAAGQFADMSRKMLKLQRSLWEGQRLEGEQPEEILADLVAHILLTMKFLRDDNLRGEAL